MRKTRVFGQLMGVQGMVFGDVAMQPDRDGDGEVLVVSVRPDARSGGRCAQCRRSCPGYDAGVGTRRWRTVDTGTTRTFLESAAPRVQCPDHGVLVAHVPWNVDRRRPGRDLAPFPRPPVLLRNPLGRAAGRPDPGRPGVIPQPQVTPHPNKTRTSRSALNGLPHNSESRDVCVVAVAGFAGSPICTPSSFSVLIFCHQSSASGASTGGIARPRGVPRTTWQCRPDVLYLLRSASVCYTRLPV